MAMVELLATAFTSGCGAPIVKPPVMSIIRMNMTTGIERNKEINRHLSANRFFVFADAIPFILCPVKRHGSMSQQ